VYSALGLGIEVAGSTPNVFRRQFVVLHWPDSWPFYLAISQRLILGLLKLRILWDTHTHNRSPRNRGLAPEASDIVLILYLSTRLLVLLPDCVKMIKISVILFYCCQVTDTSEEMEEKSQLEEQLRAVMDKYKYKRRQIRELQEDLQTMSRTMDNLGMMPQSGLINLKQTWWM